jgi:hypothetical protein
VGATLRCGDPIVVFRPEPGTDMGHVCEPRLARLPSGDVLLSHRVGSGRVSADGTIQMLVSPDGMVWRLQGCPFSNVVEGQWGDFQIAPLAVTPSGRVVATLSWVDRSGTEDSFINPVTEGRLPLIALSTTSDDGGVSWTNPVPIDVHPYRQAAPQSLLQLTSGDLLATFETFKEYDETSPWDYCAGLIRSTDQGATWHRSVAAACVGDDGVMWWDPRIADFPDGRLVQFYHAFHHPTATDREVYVGWSDDGGNTWSPPTTTGLCGQMASPVTFPDGRLLLCVQRRHAPRGLVLYLSNDGGRSFNTTTETFLYMHEGESGGAADGRVSVSDYFADMDVYTFGHPTGIALDDHRALFCYYAGTRGRTAIHAVTVHLE